MARIPAGRASGPSDGSRFSRPLPRVRSRRLFSAADRPGPFPSCGRVPARHVRQDASRGRPAEPPSPERRLSRPSPLRAPRRRAGSGAIGLFFPRPACADPSFRVRFDRAPRAPPGAAFVAVRRIESLRASGVPPCSPPSLRGPFGPQSLSLTPGCAGRSAVASPRRSGSRRPLSFSS